MARSAAAGGAPCGIAGRDQPQHAKAKRSCALKRANVWAGANLSEGRLCVGSFSVELLAINSSCVGGIFVDYEFVRLWRRCGLLRVLIIEIGRASVGRPHIQASCSLICAVRASIPPLSLLHRADIIQILRLELLRLGVFRFIYLLSFLGLSV